MDVGTFNNNYLLILNSTCATLYKTRHDSKWTYCINEQFQTLANIYKEHQIQKILQMLSKQLKKIKSKSNYTLRIFELKEELIERN